MPHWVLSCMFEQSRRKLGSPKTAKRAAFSSTGAAQGAAYRVLDRYLPPHSKSDGHSQVSAEVCVDLPATVGVLRLELGCFSGDGKGPPFSLLQAYSHHERAIPICTRDGNNEHVFCILNRRTNQPQLLSALSSLYRHISRVINMRTTLWTWNISSLLSQK